MKGDSYPCPQCDKTFSRQQHVYRHLRTHTGECPFECQLCEDKFQRADMLTRHHAKTHPTEPVPNTTSTATASQPSSLKRKRPKQEEPSSLARSKATAPATSVVESSDRPGPSAPKHTRRSKYVEMAGELEREMQQGGSDAYGSSYLGGLYGDPGRRPLQASELPLQPFPGSFATEPYPPPTLQPAVGLQPAPAYVPPQVVDPALLMEHWDRHHPGFAGSLSSAATGIGPVDTLLGVRSGSSTGASTAVLGGAPYEFDGRTWGVQTGEDNVDWNALMTGFDGTANGAGDGDVDWQTVEAGMADQAWMAGLLEHDAHSQPDRPPQLTIVPPHPGSTQARQRQYTVGQGEVSLLSPPDSAAPSASSHRYGLPSSSSTPSPAGDPFALQQYSASVRNFAIAILSSLPPLSIVARSLKRANAPIASAPSPPPQPPRDQIDSSPSSTILERRAARKLQQHQQAVLTMAATATSAAASTAVALTTAAATLAPTKEPSAQRQPPTPTGWFTLEKKNLIRTRSQKAVEQIAPPSTQASAATATKATS